jgi:predicted ATP-dependent endonuclease of OLD family
MKTIVETDDSGHDVLKEVPVVQNQNSSLRQCDTCFVAANCPAFKPQNSCAFNLPVEVKTKDQLKALLTAIIEMQGQRVAFMRFAEEMNGGYADPNLSQEIDRLLKLVGNVNEMDSNKEFIQITASRQSSGGVLSAIFGDRAQALRELPETMKEETVTKIISQSIED